MKFIPYLCIFTRNAGGGGTRSWKRNQAYEEWKIIAVGGSRSCGIDERSFTVVLPEPVKIGSGQWPVKC